MRPSSLRQSSILRRVRCQALRRRPRRRLHRQQCARSGRSGAQQEASSNSGDSDTADSAPALDSRGRGEVQGFSLASVSPTSCLRVCGPSWRRPPPACARVQALWAPPLHEAATGRAEAGTALRRGQGQARGEEAPRDRRLGGRAEAARLARHGGLAAAPRCERVWAARCIWDPASQLLT